MNIFINNMIFMNVLSDLFAPPSAEDDGLFGDAGPFKKKGGLFSGGGGLFDDNDQV